MPQPAPASPVHALKTVKDAVAVAEQSAGRPAGSTTLIVVSKTFGADHILPLLAAGQRQFGENRVQEAQDKWPALRAAFPDLELHLLGPLQSNKVKDAVALFDVIESLDRPKIAAALAEEMKRRNRRIPVLIQVNTGEEPQKAGVAPRDADAFVAACRALDLDVRGLMCIPPAAEDPSPHFALLREIARRNDLHALSMGMSDDYRLAVPLGATHVRIGSAVFGRRA